MKRLLKKGMNSNFSTSDSGVGLSVIGSNVRIDGNVSSDGEVQIDGSVEGDIQAAAVIIGHKGMVNGHVKTDNLIVRGGIHGGIVSNNVELCSGCNVEGDIMIESLSIEPGALFEGKVQHSPKSQIKIKPEKKATVSSDNINTETSSIRQHVKAVPTS